MRENRLDDWTLTPQQFDWMQAHAGEIDHAYMIDEDDWFHEVIKTPEYKHLFKSITWDEAYDRYECLLEEH